MDLGIARQRLIDVGTASDTSGYAPPEPYQGQAEPRTDQYTLAALLHHLLTGRDPEHAPPFTFPPVRDLAPAVSPHVAAAVSRALNLPQTDRFESMATFLQ